jgi:hypothetical protein
VIHDRAVQDLFQFYQREGRDITLTKQPGDLVQPVVKGLVHRVDEEKDPVTGVSLHAPKTVISFSLYGLPEEPRDGWDVSTTDSMGKVVSGKIRSPRFDHVKGEVKFHIEV